MAPSHSKPPTQAESSNQAQNRSQKSETPALTALSAAPKKMKKLEVYGTRPPVVASGSKATRAPPPKSKTSDEAYRSLSSGRVQREPAARATLPSKEPPSHDAANPHVSPPKPRIIRLFSYARRLRNAEDESSLPSKKSSSHNAAANPPAPPPLKTLRGDPLSDSYRSLRLSRRSIEIQEADISNSNSNSGLQSGFKAHLSGSTAASAWDVARRKELMDLLMPESELESERVYAKLPRLHRLPPSRQLWLDDDFDDPFFFLTDNEFDADKNEGKGKGRMERSRVDTSNHNDKVEREPAVDVAKKTSKPNPIRTYGRQETVAEGTFTSPVLVPVPKHKPTDAKTNANADVESDANSFFHRSLRQKRRIQEVEMDDSVGPKRKISKTAATPAVAAAATSGSAPPLKASTSWVAHGSPASGSGSGLGRERELQRGKDREAKREREEQKQKQREIEHERERALERSRRLQRVLESQRQEKQSQAQAQAQLVAVPAAPAPAPPQTPLEVFPPELEEWIAQRVLEALQPAFQSMRVERDVERKRDREVQVQSEKEREEREIQRFADLERRAAEREAQHKEEREAQKMRDEARDKATADMHRALGILAGRVGDVRRDVGGVLRGLGVRAPTAAGAGGGNGVEGDTAAGTSAPEDASFAAIGRERRRLARGVQDIEVVASTNAGVEVIDADMDETSQLRAGADGKSVLDRLTGLGMDIQECLERLRDPMAGCIVEMQTLAQEP